MPPNGHMYGLNFTLKSRAESQVFMSAVYMYGLYLKQPEPIFTVVSSLPLDVRSCTLPYVPQVQSSLFQAANAALWQ